MAKYILFDTETTGVGEHDRIIQVGAMIVDPKGNVEKFDELCGTDLEIPVEAMEVHGITPDKIENKPAFLQSKFYAKLQELNNQENFLIASCAFITMSYFCASFSSNLYNSCEYL